MPQRRSVHHAWEHPFVWDQERYAAVLALFGTGRSDYEIARITGVPRSTVLNGDTASQRPARGTATTAIGGRRTPASTATYLGCTSATATSSFGTTGRRS